MPEKAAREYKELLRAGKWFRALTDDFQDELLASVLGLEDLNEAATRLRQARLSRESAFKEVSKSLRGLLIRLEGTADERAGVCLAALPGSAFQESVHIPRKRRRRPTLFDAPPLAGARSRRP